MSAVDKFVPLQIAVFDIFVGLTILISFKRELSSLIVVCLPFLNFARGNVQNCLFKHTQLTLRVFIPVNSYFIAVARW